jgi:hypothetical protein
MAIIYTYPVKSIPVNADKILISDSADNNKTKQITVESIKGLTAGVTQIIAGTNVTIDPVGGTGNVTINASSVSTPGGSNTQMQYNNGGSFGGTTGLTWDDSTNILSIGTRFEGDIDGAVLQQVLVKEPGGVSKGDVVYISGGTGDNPEVRKAQASSISTMAALGIMKANTAEDAVGECVTSGEITGLNLTGFTTGDELFVSNAVAGELLTSAPAGEANLVQKIGRGIKGGNGGALTVLDAFRTNATPNLNQGSLFIGNASNQASTLGIGGNNTVLKSNGTTATWAAESGISFSGSTAGGIATYSNSTTAAVSSAFTVSGNKLSAPSGTLADPSIEVGAIGGLYAASGGIFLAHNGADAIGVSSTSIVNYKLTQFNSGLKFGSTGETLNSYEEGTWTPTAAQAVGTPPTTASSAGTYTKIGNIVHITFSLVVTGSSSINAAALISGLPFSPSSTDGHISAGNLYVNSDSNTPANYPSTFNVSTGFIALYIEGSTKASNTGPLGLEIDATASWHRPSGGTGITLKGSATYKVA